MKYSLKTEYTIKAPPEIIWDTLADVESWPDMLSYFRYVRFMDDEKILKQHAVILCEVKAVLPYTLRFNTEIIKVIPHKELEVISRGDLSGKGLWTLKESDDGTISTFTWEVEPENMIMRIIGFTLPGRLLLIYSHNIIMKSRYKSFLNIINRNKIS